MASYMILPGGIHLGFKSGHPVTVAKSDEIYAKVEAAVKSGASDEVLRDILEEKVRSVKNALCEGLEFKNEQVYHEGEFVGEVLSARLIQMVEEGFNLKPLVRFIERLKQNPSHRVVSRLYAFLEKGKNPITEDGCFLAYKAVRADYMDIHSGTFNNAVGQCPTMPRNKVDEDPKKTCSKGLHVCSFEYLPHFAHKNGHVMICKVDPADVVAIPSDYNNTKMRVCRYEVVGEHEQYYSAQREDVLAKTSVCSSAPECVADPCSNVSAEEVLVSSTARISGNLLYEVVLVRQDSSRELLASGMDEDEALEHAVLGVSFNSPLEYVEVVCTETREVVRTIR